MVVVFYVCVLQSELAVLFILIKVEAACVCNCDSHHYEKEFKFIHESFITYNIIYMAEIVTCTYISPLIPNGVLILVQKAS